MSIPESALNYGSILTLAGENAEINGKLNSKSINFTHIAIGDANDVYVQPSRTQTALVHELARIPITGMEKITPSKPDAVPQLKVWAKIPDDIVDIAVREFAAVATFDGTSYLHAIGNTVRIPILSGSNNGGEVNDIYIEMTFAVTSLDPIVMIDPTIVTATRKFVKDEDAKHLLADNPHPQYLSLTSYAKDALSFKQEWSALVNYGIGHEVVRNGLRYIALVASGPDNGGAVEPSSPIHQSARPKWSVVLPTSETVPLPTGKWIKIVEYPDSSTDWQTFELELIGGDWRGNVSTFSCSLKVSRRLDSGAGDLVVTAETRSAQASLDSSKLVTLHSRKSNGVSELWVKAASAAQAKPFTIFNYSSASSNSGGFYKAKAGILTVDAVEPTDLTLIPYDIGYQFASIPIGAEIAFDTPPPTNDPRFRFVELTADSPYNGDLLINKSISGTAPNLIVKMTVNSALSPMNGQQIYMLNTMGAIPTPGLISGEVIQDAIRNLTGSFGLDVDNGTIRGAFYAEGDPQPGAITSNIYSNSDPIKFDASRQVPTAERVQVFSVVRPLYKRVY